MKQIGLLGGTAWPSTINYYRYLNQLAQEHYGEGHSARILLRSIDYAPIVDSYRTNWSQALELFRPELNALFAAAPDCVVVCCNTLHRAVDELSDVWPRHIPLIHMVDETARRATRARYRRLLLLGTQFTMENGYYSDRLQRSGFDVVIPEPVDRRQIQAYQSIMASGDLPSGSQDYFQALLDRHSDCDAAVMACTELPPMMDGARDVMPLLDPLKIQCDAAFRFASNLSGDPDRRSTGAENT